MNSPAFLGSPLARYSLAVAVMLAAVALRWALVPLLGLNVPYVTVYPAMMFTAITLGAGPGVLAAVLGVALAEYYFMPPTGIEWNPALVIRAGIPLLTSLYVGRVSQRLRDARARADAETAAARAAEAALRQQVELMDHAQEALIVRELGGVIRSWNRGAEALYGWPAAQALGQRIGALLRTEQRLIAAKEAHLEQTGRWEGELSHTARDGRRVTVESRETATRTADGRLLVLESNRDITARKQAEESLRQAHDELELRVRERTAELKQAMEALEAGRRRFQDVLDQLPAYLVLLSPDYHVPFANRFFEQRFGKANGQRCYEYLFHRTEPCEICETYSVLKTNAPHRWEWTGPDDRNYDIYDFPFTDADGSPLIMEVGLDITERKQAEAELAKHREHLEELVKERTAQLAAANAQLQASNEELSRFNRAMVDRELRMIELKHEVNALCTEGGQPARYPPEFKDQP